MSPFNSRILPEFPWVCAWCCVGSQAGRRFSLAKCGRISKSVSMPEKATYFCVRLQQQFWSIR